MSKFRLTGENGRDGDGVDRSNVFMAQSSEMMPDLYNLDITSFDIPYISGLLALAHVRWLQQCSDLKWMSALDTAVFTPMGTRVGVGRADEEWLILIQQVLKSGTLQLSVPDSRNRVAAVPILSRHGGELFAVLVFAAPTDSTWPASELLQTTALHFRACFYQCFEYKLFSSTLNDRTQSEREAKLRSTMFQIASNIHDKTDVDSVLGEVCSSMDSLLPGTQLTLFLSDDRHSDNPGIKQLLPYQGEGNIGWQAFVQDTVIHSWTVNDEQRAQGENSATLKIAVPLRGRWGIYGVFVVELPPGTQYPEQGELDMITMLADIAGTAFEKASLLEQSSKVNDEFRRINMLIQRLHRSLRLHDIFTLVVQELMNVFSAEHCVIIRLNEQKNCFEVIDCTFEDSKGKEFPINYGFMGILYATGEPIILADYVKQSPLVSFFMEDTMSRSLMAVPLTISGVVKGAIFLTHRAPYCFSYNHYKMLQTIAPHIAIAIMNASLHAQVKQLADTDVVTGLFNRRYLNTKIMDCQKNDLCGSLILLDIDHFKKINDTYGHLKGDEILKHIGQVLLAAVGERDICARWGGEELAVYMPEAGVEQAFQCAELIRGRVSEGLELAVTVSCGIADWSRDGDDINLEALFHRADMALYRAKAMGRNQVVSE